MTEYFISPLVPDCEHQWSYIDRFIYLGPAPEKYIRLYCCMHCKSRLSDEVYQCDFSRRLIIIEPSEEIRKKYKQ